MIRQINTIKKCTKCQQMAEVNIEQSWCKPCKAKHLRENRHRYKKEDRVKKRARWVAWWHQHRSKDLIVQPCEICGSVEVHKHHEDYSRPLDVRWLCVPCHSEIHMNERKVG